MPTITPPDYEGGSLVNLVAELEHAVTGAHVAPRLHPALADLVPEADTYVVVLFDGLGAGQLDHPAAASMREATRGVIDAPFPSTTTVSLATIATGLPPSRHGLLGYQLWMPEVGEVVNTIKWTTLWGDPVEYDTTRLLPAPNLWERLAAAGIEPIAVQPANFEGSALTNALYRGCRFEGIRTLAEQVDATVALAAVPGRVIYTYLASVDFAAHVHGQGGEPYAEAVAVADWLWARLTERVPAGVALVGTADHGHRDFPRERQFRIPKAAHAGRTFYGDGRAMFVRGDGASLAADLPAEWVPVANAAPWWGPGPAHPAFGDRAPDGVLLADDDALLLHRFSDDRMIGNHGALTEAERRVPVVVRAAG